MRIAIPGGGEVALGKLIERSRIPVPEAPAAPASPGAEPASEPERAKPDLDLTDPATVERLVGNYEEQRLAKARAGDLFTLAEMARERGDVDQALALYLSVPKDHPEYSRSRRRIGWDLYTQRLSEPERGIAFVNQALFTRPFEENSWQDLARVYGRTLGIHLR